MRNDKKTTDPKQTGKKVTKTSDRNRKPTSQFKEKKSSVVYSKLNSLFNISNLPPESISVLNNFDDVIHGVKPLNSRQLQQLPDNIRSLSHQLTDKRSERRLGYMNDNVQLSSYVRYYTWWNLVRLTRLFSNLPDSVFPKTDCVALDLGSGPLTVITALWLARPELRFLKINWYCLDVSANSMALGEDVYLSTVARTSGEPWKIIRVKGSFGTNIRQKADFITCANMFNELDQASDMPPEFQSKKYFDQLKNYASPSATFILVEPGVPKAARTLSLLRTRFLGIGKTIAAPCPHADECPMNGFKAYTGSRNKWCNFAFNTDDAPAKLLKLSERAKLPKERATLSFIAVSNENISDAKNSDLLCRVASDPIKLPGYRTGYYACSKLGLSLLTVPQVDDKKQLTSGELLSVKIKTPDSLPKDEKSGACIISL